VDLEVFFFGFFFFQIDLATHQGATGPLNPKATGSKTRYHASWDTECLFHIATDIPNATPMFVAILSPLFSLEALVNLFNPYHQQQSAAQESAHRLQEDCGGLVREPY
jgi:hypothetical protein